jgi:hypothetical protein
LKRLPIHQADSGLARLGVGREIERIREGLADAEAGRLVAHEDVLRWLDSWGTENELPPPNAADPDAPRDLGWRLQRRRQA